MCQLARNGVGVGAGNMPLNVFILIKTGTVIAWASGAIPREYGARLGEARKSSKRREGEKGG